MLGSGFAQMGANAGSGFSMASVLPYLGSVTQFAGGLAGLFGGGDGTSKEFDKSMDFAKDQFGYTKKMNNRQQRNYKQALHIALNQARRSENRADSQIRRTVQDAKAAGIHPLAALGGGGQAAGFAAPVMPGFSSGGGAPAGSGGVGLNPYAAGLDAMGGALSDAYAQDLDIAEAERDRAFQAKERALDRAYSSRQVPLDPMQKQMNQLALEEARLRVDLLKSDLNQANASMLKNMFSGGPGADLSAPKPKRPPLNLGFLGEYQPGDEDPAQTIENEIGETADWIAFVNFLKNMWGSNKPRVSKAEPDAPFFGFKFTPRE